MKKHVFIMLVLLAEAPRLLTGGPAPAAALAFDAYGKEVEARLDRQHRSTRSFLAAPSFGSENRLLKGELVIERLGAPAGTGFHGAMLHHWRGTAFAPGAKAANFERVIRDFDSYPRYFAPQVLSAKVVSRDGDRLQAWMRVRQRYVITVVLETSYDIRFGRLDGQHGYNQSTSTRIAEIDAPGTNAERALNDDEEHGFLWRLNSYWSYEERDGGLYLQIEAISLSRSIPRGLGWAIQPYVESVPRESMEFTLRGVCKAVLKGQKNER